VIGKLRNIESLKSVYGSSIDFATSAADTLSGLMIGGSSEGDLSSCMDAAHTVAGCGYEYGTKWGSEVRASSPNRALKLYISQESSPLPF